MDTLHTKHEKEIVLIQILYLYLIPVILLYFKIIPGNMRFGLLFTVALLLVGIIWHSRWTYADMGITNDWKKDAIPYILFTLGGIFFLVWLAQVVPHEPFLDWWENKKFLLLFAPISILQEIVFRGILMKMLVRAFSQPLVIISINAIVFALMHVIYSNAVFILPLTFIGGIGFAWMYYRYPNLILISLAHTVLNFTAMILGFFVLRS
ncbi:MAG: CPBP family intramembrane metalloprotease [Candidatus Pacebacteria bacterium]|jgi:membrane protease YdiL (CAAX protease family)|nr:CPBP family intramembrane metalloprotease [Candidatus Paceibacterota bacterium]